MGRKREKIVKSRAQWHREDQVRRIRTFMTVIVVSLCLSVAAGALFVWRQIGAGTAARTQSGGPASSAAVSEDTEALPEYDDTFNLILVNADTALDSNFTPDLTDLDGIRVDARIVPALRELMEAAETNGTPLKLTGGYVSTADQEKLFQAQVQNRIQNKGESKIRAENEAMQSVGRGGYNENQTGMAVTFSALGQKEGEAFSSSPQYAWLLKNCVDYGFILRYPKGKESVTGMSFNPAHFRYVGRDNARSMRELSMSLEEYVAYLVKQKNG